MLRTGLHPVAVWPRQKRPIGNSWAASYPTRERLLSTFERHRRAGIGIALGPVAGVVDFEIDDPDEPFTLPMTLGWSSARGQHRLYLWDKRLEGLPSVVHIGGAEVRIGAIDKQLYSVCPPSVGDDGRRRQWTGPWEIRPFPACLLKRIERPKPAPASKRIALPVGANRYALAALRYEAKAVATAEEGGRNRQLNKSAFSLGGLVVVGLLDRAAVEAALTEAALSARLGEREIAITLKSGLDAGIKRPRKV